MIETGKGVLLLIVLFIAEKPTLVGTSSFRQVRKRMFPKVGRQGFYEKESGWALYGSPRDIKVGVFRSNIDK